MCVWPVDAAVRKKVETGKGRVRGGKGEAVGRKKQPEQPTALNLGENFSIF